MLSRWAVTAVLVFALVVAPVSGADSHHAWGSLKSQGRTEVNGMAVPAETTLFSGDLVTTREASLATLSLPGGHLVFVIENSAARFNADSKSVTLERGSLGVLHEGGEGVAVSSRGTLIRPAEGKAARYVVKLEDKGFVLSSLRGDVNVSASNRTVTVPSGKAMRFELAEPSPPQGSTSAGSANALSPRAIIVASVLIVAASLAIALPLALRERTPVSPAIP